MKSIPVSNIAFVLAMVIAVAASACKVPDGSGASLIAPAHAKVYTSVDIAAAGSGLTLHDALLRLLPDELAWGARNRGVPVVYLNGLRASDFSVLHDVQCGRTRKVVVIGGIDAALIYGSDHAAGAILVSLAPQTIHRAVSLTRCSG